MKIDFLILPILLTSTLSLLPIQKALAYEDTLVIASMQTVQGSLTSVDTDKRRVVVRWMADELRFKYQDLLLDVPETAVIVKNGEPVELGDLKSGDPVTVRFDQNAQPAPRAFNLTVTE